MFFIILDIQYVFGSEYKIPNGIYAFTRDISGHWYTGTFDKTHEYIVDGLDEFIRYLKLWGIK